VKILKQLNLSILVYIIIFVLNIGFIYLFTEPPSVSTNNSHILVSPGDNIDLPCSVTGETYPDIRWFKENELVRF
jgi:hypothetical protein